MKKLTRCKRAAALFLCAVILCVPLLGLAAPAQAGPVDSAVSGNEAPEESSATTTGESTAPEQTEPPTESTAPEQTEPPTEPQSCTCEVKCTAEASNGDCPVCKSDASKCEGKEPEPTPPVCTCTVKCEAGAVNENCFVCKLDRAGCVGTAPEPTPPPEPAYTITILSPSGWYTKAADVEIRIADLNGTGWQKVEYKIERGGSLIDLTDDLADTDRAKVEISENCTVYVVVTDKNGKAHTKSRYVECFDRTAPTVKAGIDGKLLRVEANDELSGVDAIYIDGDRYDDLTNGTLDVRLRDLDDDYKQISVQAVDYAGNKSKTVQLNNPNYKEPDNGKNQEDKKTSANCPEVSKPAATTPTTTITTSPATAAPVPTTNAAGSTAAKPTSTTGNKTSGAAGGTSTPAKEADDKTEDSTETTGGIEPEPITPAGNAGLVDDLFDGEKQLITVTTKNGNYFYILIDRASEDKETAVHFLNQVDEADLMALMDDGKTEKVPAACTCTEKCKAGAVNTVCPVCKTNMSECTGPEPQTQTQEPEEPIAPDKEAKSGNAGGLIVLLVVLLAGGGAALYYFKFRNPKQSVKGSDELDEYNFDEDDEDMEDEEPDAKEDDGVEPEQEDEE